MLIEPGRFISGSAGILVTRIEYVKRTGRKNFLIVDAAMNDLIRPAFYEAYHEILPITRKREPWSARMWWARSANRAISSAKTGRCPKQGREITWP